MTKSNSVNKEDSYDDRLAPMVNGLNVRLEKSDIFELNFPNYNYCDIVINELELSAMPYDPKINGNEVTGKGRCSFTGSTFPEATWEHIPANLFQIIVNQAGKAAQSITTTVNGIALRGCKSENKKPASPNDITFTKNSRVFIKAKQLFVRAYFEFFENNEKVAKYETLSIGMQRDYSELIEQKKTEKGFLVSSQIITQSQCDRLMGEQQELKKKGVAVSLKELAINNGLCTEQEVKNCLQVVK